MSVIFTQRLRDRASIISWSLSFSISSNPVTLNIGAFGGRGGDWISVTFTRGGSDCA